VEALVRSEADAAAERTAASWRRSAAGAELLDRAGEPLDRSSRGMDDRLVRLVRDWQSFVLELVRREGADRRSGARFMAYGINGGALIVMVAVFASTGGLTGAEVAVAGGASALGQKVIEAVLGDQAVRALATQARADLRERVESLLADERERFTRLLTGIDGPDSKELTETARAVEAARRVEPAR
ncbi:MAG: ABC transporter, partial [Actinomycetota bacterium]|nr:ABC transporter [Actinomycetota bacterium]